MTDKKNDSKSIIDLVIGSTTNASMEDEAKLREKFRRKNVTQVEEKPPSFIDSIEELGLPSNKDMPSYVSPHEETTSLDPHTKAYQDKISTALEEASASNKDSDDYDDIFPT